MTEQGFLIALSLISGVAALYLGARWLVGGSASLAARFGIPPLIIGLTIVAFGTSAPEMVVSVTAALAAKGGIAVGNVVGSNILNIGLILGLSALICPVRVDRQLLRLDTPVMIAATLLFIIIAANGRIDRGEGLLFLGYFIVYTAATVLIAMNMARKDPARNAKPGHVAISASPWWDGLLIIAGLALLVLGSKLFISGSVQLARRARVSETVIGLTIIAAGTSLPELATSVMAALRKQPDIAIGNIVGSNTFNILCILGVSAVVAPLSVCEIGWVDYGAMLLSAGVLLPFCWTGMRLQRWEGAALLGMYVAYLAWLWPK